MADTNVKLDLTKLLAATTKAKGAMGSAKVVIVNHDADVIAKLKADNDFDNSNLAAVQAAMDADVDELDTVATDLDAAILANSGGGTPLPPVDPQPV